MNRVTTHKMHLTLAGSILEIEGREIIGQADTEIVYEQEWEDTSTFDGDGVTPVGGKRAVSLSGTFRPDDPDVKIDVQGAFLQSVYLLIPIPGNTVQVQVTLTKSDDDDVYRVSM